MTGSLPSGAAIAPGYVVVSHLARTNRLDTYEVWSDERACGCVAKTLRPDRREDRAARAALVREGRHLRALAHPHLVRAYEVIAAPVPVVILETLTGETVDHLVSRHPGGLEPADVAMLGIQLASVLRYLHAHRLLHLDVKPGNVIAEAGRAKLLDLSVARAPGRGRPGTGTWCYLAPEQARGDVLGPPADVWGLGALLLEAATGELAFDGEEDYPQLVRRAPRAAALRPDLPPGLAAAVDACLEPDPGARPSLEALGRALGPIARLQLPAAATCTVAPSAANSPSTEK